jgi:GNAT superfamily N-acetyltransferase
VVGTLQLTFIPGMARRGALRAQIEAVRVGEAQRGLGLGREMMLWAIEESRRRGCALVQLTTDKQREAAHRFYARLGFAASHEGMKLALVSAGQQTTDLGVPLLPLDDVAGLLDTLEGDGRRS